MNKLMSYVLLILMLLGVVAVPTVYAADKNGDGSTHNGPDGPEDEEDDDDEEDECTDPGSPVYLQTMSFFWEDTDVRLRAKGELEIRRTYNSFDSTPGIFGKGWSARCESRLFKSFDHQLDDDGNPTQEIQVKYVYKSSDGKVSEFAQNGDGSFESPADLLAYNLVLSQSGNPRLEHLSGSYRDYDSLGYLISSANENGVLTNYEYQEGALTRISNNDGQYIELSYNASGFVETVEDHSGRIWSYDYNTDATLRSVTNPLGGEMLYEYTDYTPAHGVDTSALLTRVVDESGIPVIEVTYDSSGKVSSYTEKENIYTYAQVTDYIEKMDSVGSVWRYWLNSDGQIVTEQLPNGGFIQSEYDSNSRLISKVDPEGTTTRIQYDLLGRQESTELVVGEVIVERVTYGYLGNNPWPNQITTMEGRVTNYSYDESGNVIEISDSDGNTTIQSWDSENNLVSVMNALGNSVSYEYNSLGLVLRTTDELGRTSVSTYDVLGRELTSTNANGETVTFTYDDMGRQLTMLNPMGDLTTYSYDQAGKVLSVELSTGASESYSYDDYGRLVQKTSFDDGVTEYSYREDNLVLNATLPNGKIISYGYDIGKRMVSQTVDSDVTTYIYNLRDQLLSANNGVVVAFGYDDFGRKIDESFNGFNTSYSLDLDGGVVSVNKPGGNFTYTRSANNRITQISANEGNYSLSYDSLGRLTSFSRPNSQLTNNVFDASSQLVSIQHNVSGSSLYSYGFDSNGRVSNVSVNGETTSYAYDANGRLTSADSASLTYSYTYDDLGNRLDAGAVYNNANQLLENSEWVYNYDLNGNLVLKTSKSSQLRHTFQYNGLNQLIAFEVDENADNIAESVSTYTYGPFGRRVSKTVDGSTTSFYWIGSVIIREESGSTVIDYNWLPDSYIPISKTIDGVVHYYHNDHLGVPRIISDQNGLEVWAGDYSPFGELESSTDSEIDQLRFPGQYHDSESGLNYNYFRYYDPALGRYVQADPIGIGGGFNVYNYTLSNPVNAVDPQGLNTVAIGAGGGFAVGGPAGAVIGGIGGIIVGGAIWDWLFNRNWTCTASCNVQQIDNCANCPERTSGTATGRNEEAACRAAKRVATQSTPRGCYSRHCRCVCSKG